MILPELFAQVARSFSRFQITKPIANAWIRSLIDVQSALTFFINRELLMSRVCQVTGKRPMTGNNVSHAHNKTTRRLLPNLQSRRFWVESENRWVRMLVSKKGVRIIDKKAIETVLANIRSRKKTA